MNCSRKFDLLLEIRADPQVTWSGRHWPPLNKHGVYPRALQQPLPVWIASGGTPQSVARAGALGLPLAIAIPSLPSGPALAVGGVGF
jgi:alkanesulfonate monooxygenase SsuD/methylene tetrahydromethanopterin reductase-like flavin-dependent oxidoreductase (luciferase family)